MIHPTIIFLQPDTLRLCERYSVLDILKGKADNEIAIRILISRDYLTGGSLVGVLSRYKQIDTRYLTKSIQTNLTTITVDREISLVIEEKRNEDPIGIATYSNSESTAISYASIFENLWVQSAIL